MAPSLDDLPVELIERVVDYLPHRETLLHLRLVSPSLNAKVSRRFGEAYFTTSVWRLTGSNARAIVHFSHRPEVTASLSSVTLVAPCSKHTTYHDIWMAKSIDLAKINRALALFQNLRSLKLHNFGKTQGLQRTSDFFGLLSTKLHLPKLESLDLIQVDVDADFAIQLLENHNQTLTTLSLDNVDLRYNENAKAGFHTPWFDLLYSMKDFKNHCDVSIESAWENGKMTFLDPPWAEWPEFGDGVYVYKGLSINLVYTDLDDEEDSYDMHTEIWVKGDGEWWDGIKRLAAFYICSTVLGELSEVGCHISELSDTYWDEKIAECLDIKYS
ncbi:hypothetical protein FKW77_004174 [Venturia effusa]|uniref:F-box domain-containing protein n=1 Tax=Venturia effusa TaxID=50376 RepID=A0A517LK25_9PEZI|nr:hypothetical protein FKW77_004174 [Venturia effusa]